MSEPCRWRRGERYETCVDDGVRGSAPKLCMAYSRARCLPSSEQSPLRAEHPCGGIPYSAPLLLLFQLNPLRWASAGVPMGGYVLSAGSIGTMFLVGELSTLSTLRRQMSRSPLLLRKVTEIPLRLRAATLLRI